MPDNLTPRFGICVDCGHIAAWMGKNIACEADYDCSGYYEPATREDLDDSGMSDEEEFEDE